MITYCLYVEGVLKVWSGSSGYCRGRSAEASLALVVSAGRPSVFCAKREKNTIGLHAC